MAEEQKKELPHIGTGGVKEIPKDSPAEETPDATTESPASTPPPATVDTPPVPKGDGSKSSGGKSKLFNIIVLVLVALICAALGAAAMWYYSDTQSSDTSSTDANDEDTDTEESGESPDAEEVEDDEDAVVVSWSTFTGDYVTGEHPDDWTITEYFDGDGSDMLVDGSTYTGLTGLTIQSPSRTVFKLQAVYGIGGISACSDYFEFPDSEAAYYTDIVDQSAVHGITPTVTSYTAGDYTEFELFEKNVRRVDHNLYWDRDATDSYFNAECGISAQIFIFDSPTYTADAETKGDYQFTVDDTATDEELETLDALLNSLVAL